MGTWRQRRYINKTSHLANKISRCKRFSFQMKISTGFHSKWEFYKNSFAVIFSYARNIQQQNFTFSHNNFPYRTVSITHFALEIFIKRCRFSRETKGIYQQIFPFSHKNFPFQTASIPSGNFNRVLFQMEILRFLSKIAVFLPRYEYEYKPKCMGFQRVFLTGIKK